MRRSGAAIVELALTLSILFSICYGTIAYGYYFFVKNTMEDAVREACRAGIVSGATITGTGGANSVAENQLQVSGLVPTGTSASGGTWAPARLYCSHRETRGNIWSVILRCGGYVRRIRRRSRG